jgi:hypothetical protein
MCTGLVESLRADLLLLQLRVFVCVHDLAAFERAVGVWWLQIEGTLKESLAACC